MGICAEDLEATGDYTVRSDTTPYTNTHLLCIHIYSEVLRDAYGRRTVCG